MNFKINQQVILIEDFKDNFWNQTIKKNTKGIVKQVVPYKDNTVWVVFEGTNEKYISISTELLV